MEDLKEDQEAKKHSRKYRLALLGLGVIVFGWIVAGLVPALGPAYGELIAGVLGTLVVYYGGNVANKHIVGNQLVKLEQSKDSEGDQ